MAHGRWGAVLMVGGVLALLHACGSDRSAPSTPIGGAGGSQSGNGPDGPASGSQGGEGGAGIVLTGGSQAMAGEASSGAPHAGRAGESSVGGAGGSSDSGGSSGAGGSSAEVDGCASSDVLFLIPHDDDMFELPNPNSNYMMMAKEALTGPGGALAPVETRLRMRAVFFWFSDNYIGCPFIGGYSEPRPTLVADLGVYFDEVLDSYPTALGNLFDPVKDALEFAAGKLKGNNRHVVLLTTGYPDTCTLGQETFCLTDPTIKAVQDAYAAGIATHVIGLGDVSTRDLNDSQSYERYLGQLATAGSGQPVSKLAEYPFEYCAGHGVPSSATYSDSSGDTTAYQAKDAADIKDAVTAILGSICPAEL